MLTLVKKNTFGKVENQIFINVNVPNANELLNRGLIYLKQNRLGFAKAFFQHAAKLNHTVAEHHLLILNNQELPVHVRIGTILNHY
jgi:hypothetical protein